MDYHYEFSAEELKCALPKVDIGREAMRVALDRLNAETERWIWKAMTQGVGNRVWRSNASSDPWPSAVVRHQFAILAPGQSAPGAGTIFGPFSTT